MTKSYALPRTILGNRGDIASRWGVLLALHSLGVEKVAVYRDKPIDLPQVGFEEYDYGGFRNLLTFGEQDKGLSKADEVLWAVGLDFQDDSSLAKLIYLNIQFLQYKIRGKKVFCAYQGAGPLRTTVGRSFARLALGKVDGFIARDPGTAKLIRQVSPSTSIEIAHDAIFMPGFEQYETALRDNGVVFGIRSEELRIGINLRQWFHFSSSVLPYQLKKRSFRKRSSERMGELEESFFQLITMLNNRLNARFFLISAYQPGVVPWEDDLPWLKRLHSRFDGQDNVELIDKPLTMPHYFHIMANLDLMIGMRLHSTLIALRFGVPAINLSYTLKGTDILTHLGLPDLAIELGVFLNKPGKVLDRALEILEDRERQSEAVRDAVNQASQKNYHVLSELVNDNLFGISTRQ